MKNKKFLIVLIVSAIVIALIIGGLFIVNKKGQNKENTNNYTAYVSINPLVKLEFLQTCNNDTCNDPIITNYELISDDAKDIYKDIKIKKKSNLIEALLLICETAKNKGIVFDNVSIYSDWDKVENYIDENSTSNNWTYNINIKKKDELKNIENSLNELSNINYKELLDMIAEKSVEYSMDNFSAREKIITEEISLSTLINENYIKDEKIIKLYNNNICDAYSIITADAVETAAKAYLKCNNYKSEGYDENHLKKEKALLTVKFNTNGGNNINSVKIEKGTKISQPATPTKNGYKFVEWQLNNKKFDFNSIINNDITLTVKWEKINNNNNQNNTADNKQDNNPNNNISNNESNVPPVEEITYFDIPWEIINDGTYKSFAKEHGITINLVADIKYQCTGHFSPPENPKGYKKGDVVIAYGHMAENHDVCLENIYLCGINSGEWYSCTGDECTEEEKATCHINGCNKYQTYFMFGACGE